MFDDFKIQFSGGFAFFAALIVVIYLYIFFRLLWIYIFGGTIVIKVESKGFIPQLLALFRQQKEYRKEMKALHEEIDQMNKLMKMGTNKLIEAALSESDITE